MSVDLSVNNMAHKESKETTYIRIFLLILLVWGVTIAVLQETSFDLQRYYQMAEINVETRDLSGVIEESREHNVDFLYYVILYTALSIGIPLNLVTVTIVSLYFFLIISCFKEIWGGKIDGWILFVILFATPTCWVVSISRNLTAIMFLYIAVKAYYHKRWLFVLLFSVLAVFTHFSVLMFLAVLVTSFFLRKMRIKKEMLLFVIMAFLVAGVIFPAYVQNLFFDLIVDQDIRYSNYSTRNDFGMLRQSLNYAVQLPTLLALSFSILLLFLNKKQGFEFWALFILTVMLSAFVLSSWTLTNRCMMILPMFWGLNVALIYKNSYVKKNKTLRIFSFIGVIIILLGIYGMRNIYFPFLY